jgi:hypothetical protein
MAYYRDSFYFRELGYLSRYSYWAMRWMAGESGFDSQQGQKPTFRQAQGPTQPPIQRVPGTLSIVVKWQGCEADDPLTIAVFKNGGGIPPLPHTPSWHNA